MRWPIRKHSSVAWCEVYFDTLNRVGVAQECDRQTDGQTDGQVAFSNTVRRELTSRRSWHCAVPRSNKQDLNAPFAVHYSAMKSHVAPVHTRPTVTKLHNSVKLIETSLNDLFLVLLVLFYLSWILLQSCNKQDEWSLAPLKSYDILALYKSDYYYFFLLLLLTAIVNTQDDSVQWSCTCVWWQDFRLWDHDDCQ